MQGKADRDLQERESAQRVAPAEPFESFQRQRPERRARQAAHQRERRERGPIRRAGMLAQRRERGIVERHRHRDAGQRPRRVERDRGVRVRDGEQGERASHRADAHHQAPAVAIDGAAGERCGQCGQEKAQGIRAEQRCGGKPKLFAHARAEHRNRIIKRPPGNDLRQAERGYEADEDSPGHDAMLTWRRAL